MHVTSNLRTSGAYTEAVPETISLTSLATILIFEFYWAAVTHPFTVKHALCAQRGELAIVAVYLNLRSISQRR